MGILARAALGFGDSGAFKGLERAAADFTLVQIGRMGTDGFFDLRADADDGIERGHGLLKNHGDFAAA